MSSFTRDTPTLEFNPRPHARVQARMHIAWPAWAYRVVAPASQPRELNPFQRAVLGLANAGVNDRQEAGRLLQLEPALITHIQAELTQAELLDNLGFPSDTGRAVLNGDSEGALDDGRQVTGYVFQDPITHQFWPRFVEQLSYATVAERGDRLVVVHERDHREYRDDLHLELLGETESPPAPTPFDVIRANRDHQRMLKRLKRGAHEEQVGDLISPREVNRVQLIEAQPRPVYLRSVLYYPEGDDVQHWSAADPFGFGQSPLLHRLITSRLGHSERLREVVAAFERPHQQRAAVDIHAWQQEHLQRILKHMETLYPRRVEDFPVFYQTLVDAETTLGEVVALSSTRQPDLEGVLTSWRKVVEGLFVTLRECEPTPIPPVWKSLTTDDREYNASVMALAGRDVGLSQPLPDPLSKVDFKKIKGALNPLWHIQPTPLMAATVLLAAKNPAHPLRHAAHINPDVIRQLDHVYRQTSGASHYGEKSELNVAGVQQLVADVRQAVSLLLTPPESATL